MNKTYVITAFLFVATLLVLLIGCKQAPLENNQGNLFNESLNQQIENITNTNISTNVSAAPVFKEFYFNYTSRPEAKYEIAKDDVFTISNGNFNSTQISFLGVMLGDSYDSVIQRIGIPNHEFTPYDKSYVNVDYNRRIGIEAADFPITFHFENNTLTRINIRDSFNKYLHGNATIGQSKDTIYALLDVPDYQSFITNYKVFHYVGKGLELYFPDRYVGIMSFIPPEKFKGVEYVTTRENMSNNVVINITEPVEIK